MTTRIAYGSDLHLEFGGLVVENSVSADLLVLAGDVCVAEHFTREAANKTDKKSKRLRKVAARYREFFDIVAEEFPYTVMVMGNHEHYDGDIQQTGTLLKSVLADYPNIQLLEEEIYRVREDLIIAGATLWTDMGRENPLTMHEVGYCMSDFHCISNSAAPRHPYRYGNPKFTVQEAVRIHEKSRDYFKIIAETHRESTVVVVSHHAPSEQSSDPRFRADLLTNAYYSELSELILSNPNIAVWIHGHMHNASDYRIGETRVVCNPRGYIGHEKIANNFQLRYVDI